MTINGLRPALLFLLSLTLLSACIVSDLTGGKTCPDTCNMNHRLNGKKTIVGTRYGKVGSRAHSYPFAKKPRAMGCVKPLWPKARLARIYVCDSCTFLWNNEKRKRINESW